MKNQLICVLGPTASGKTSLSIKIAQALDTEIISCDSRQFYKELKIGAAPPSKEELSAVPHHFIQEISVQDSFNAGDFEAAALERLEQIFSNHNHSAVLVGGSGLYADALLVGFDEMPEIEKGIRNQLNQEFEQFGLDPLLKELEQNDLSYYEKVDRNNPVRIIRALEVIRATGKPFSSYRNQKKATRNFEVQKIAIDWPREELYDRINQRVDLMVTEGLVEEVKALVEFQDLQSLNTVGYKEIFEYLNGNCSLEKAIEEIKKNTRRFAKRQLTWLRKDSEIFWVNPKSDLLPQIAKHYQWD